MKTFNPTPKTHVTPREAARLKKTSLATIYRAIEAGVLPIYGVWGKGWLIRRSDLADWRTREEIRASCP